MGVGQRLEVVAHGVLAADENALQCEALRAVDGLAVGIVERAVLNGDAGVEATDGILHLVDHGHGLGGLLHLGVAVGVGLADELLPVGVGGGAGIAGIAGISGLSGLSGISGLSGFAGGALLCELIAGEGE